MIARDVFDENPLVGRAPKCQYLTANNVKRKVGKVIAPAGVGYHDVPLAVSDAMRERLEKEERFIGIYGRIRYGVVHRTPSMRPISSGGTWLVTNPLKMEYALRGRPN